MSPLAGAITPGCFRRRGSHRTHLLLSQHFRPMSQTRSEAFRYGRQCAQETQDDEDLRDRLLKGCDVALINNQTTDFIDGVCCYSSLSRPEATIQVSDAITTLA